MVISSANRTAIFRCDASPAIGAGHVVRCLALADALRRDGWSCTFVCSDDSDVAVRVLAATHHELVLLPRQMADDPRALRDRWPRGRGFLIVDHYELDAKFETACRSWTKKILVIDDLADRVHDCDFIVEQDYAYAHRDITSGLEPAINARLRSLEGVVRSYTSNAAAGVGNDPTE